MSDEFGLFDYEEELGAPPVVREGVLYVAKKPEYVVEVIVDEADPKDYLTVYKPQSDEEPVKAYTWVDKTKQFRGKTTLAKLARNMIDTKERIVKETNPPLFMAPIVEGTSTFSGRTGLGFYEREPDKLVHRKGKLEMERGDYTGVFVAIDDITWKKSYVATGDIIKRYKANEKLWFFF